MTAFIYIMLRSDGLQQIGYTNRLERRLAEHRCRIGRGAAA